MIIYIYGSEGFKKDIHDVLDHSNIKFRLDEHGEIIDLDTLDDLKNAIEENPSNIYLIDDSKIIKKNSLNQKIKFLKPKDGIEQEYLLDHGIGDISVDSIDELSKHIIKRLEESIPQDDPDSIQDSIVEIVEDAYGNNDEDDESYVQLDDELSALLSSHKSSADENIEEALNEIESIDEITIPEPEIIHEEEADELKDLSFDEDFDNINITEDIEEKNENNLTNEVLQGESMSDEFSEFDTLSESDILAALDGLDNVTVSKELTQSSPAPTQTQATSSNESLNISGSSSDDIAKLITQLLNNKTLEITIKVKD